MAHLLASLAYRAEFGVTVPIGPTPAVGNLANQGVSERAILGSCGHVPALLELVATLVIALGFYGGTAATTMRKAAEEVRDYAVKNFR